MAHTDSEPRLPLLLPGALQLRHPPRHPRKGMVFAIVLPTKGHMAEGSRTAPKLPHYFPCNNLLQYSANSTYRNVSVTAGGHSLHEPVSTAELVGTYVLLAVSISVLSALMSRNAHALALARDRRGAPGPVRAAGCGRKDLLRDHRLARQQRRRSGGAALRWLRRAAHSSGGRQGSVCGAVVRRLGCRARKSPDGTGPWSG